MMDSAHPVSDTSIRRLRRFAWCTLAWNMMVVLWGAVVRASGAGAGCGSHWPLCNGEVIPQAAHLKTLIEFTHRLSSGIGLIAVLALTIFTFFLLPRRNLVRWAAALAAFFMLNEALLGALLVLLRLVEMNQSMARAVYLCLHSTNTLLLLGSIALTAWWLGHPVEAERSIYRRAPLFGAAVGLAATIVIAITGAIAALGDTLFPATTLGQAIAQDFLAHAHYALRLRLLHPLSAIVTGIYLVWLYALTLRNRDRLGYKLGVAVFVLLSVQYLLGVGDILLLAPLWLQVVHLFGADLFWIALVLFSAHTLATSPADRDEPRASVEARATAKVSAS